VGGLAGPGRHGEVVQTILALGRSLRLAVIAEGVETPEQQSYLRSAGCELGQGNLISVPLSADAASGLLAGGPEGKTVH
jgi:EAL domain-containing protein (putative c-di-GMP-specific phosphodiesterase class I)